MIIRRLGPWSLAIGLLVGPAAAADAEQGRELYRIYCRSCHGETARGDGPSAPALKKRPSDLTRLSRGRSADFPREQVTRAIDGRSELLSHGSREMPIWGLAFQQFDVDVDQEVQVQERLSDLVDYLESIQRNRPD